MPYPSPTTYPSGLLFPGLTGWGSSGSPVALGDLLLNTEDSNGVQWVLEDFNWDDSPGSTVVVTQRARGDGGTASEAFYKPMVYVLKGTIIAPTEELGLAARNAMAAAVTLDPFQLTVAEGGLVQHSMVQRQDQPIFTRMNQTDRTFSLQVVAKDPRKFGNLISATTPLPSSSGGRTYPATYPIVYTGHSETGIIRVTNTGYTQAPVWLRIDGPVPAGGWNVTHVGKKQTLTFATSLALASGEFVTVDMDRREVLAQGQAARAGYVTSRGWFSLDPGDNDIAFSAANYSATAQLTVLTKPSWS